LIRKAQISDIDDLVKLSDEFFKEGLNDYGMEMGEDCVRASLNQYIDNLILFVAYKDGELVGFIGGTINYSTFNKNQIIAQETAWFVSKKHRNGTIGLKLISAFENECKDSGANFVIMVHMNNLNSSKLYKLYGRRGYKVLETHYIKEF